MKILNINKKFIPTQVIFVINNKKFFLRINYSVIKISQNKIKENNLYLFFLLFTINHSSILLLI